MSLKYNDIANIVWPKFPLRELRHIPPIRPIQVYYYYLVTSCLETD